MSDKDLDDLFKEASGKMETPFEASEWQRMEKLLDAKGGIRGVFWNWKTYTSLSLLLLLGTTASVIWMNTKEEKIEISSKQDRLRSENKLPLTESTTTQADSTENKFETIIPQQKGKEELAIQNEESDKLIAVQNNGGKKRREPSDNKGNADSMLSSSDEKMYVDTKEENNHVVSENLLNENTKVGEAKSSEIVAVNATKPSNDSVATAIKQEEIIQKDSSEDKSSDQQVANRHSFSLKAAVSPDFTSVGYFTPGETGFNYGIMAEYGLGQHFSVLIGGIWSKKLYSSESSEADSYGPPMNSKKITGDCRILDIPILVNYYINPGHRFVVYGSAGLSSYIMFKESYNYEVVKNGKSYDYNKTVERKNNEWFKMANISVGVQYRLTNQWSLQAEPFIKAPLTGVGEGNIKLVSSGVFVNVKYTFK